MRSVRVRSKALAACIVLAASAGLAGSAQPARADTCSDCPEPSASALAAAAGTTLLNWLLGDICIYYDAGECRYAVTNPQKKMNGIVILWEGDGMAWNCPFGSADSEVKVEIGETSQFSWTVTVSGGLKLSAEALGEVTAGFGRTDEMTHVRTLLASITSPIKAASGHKVQWHGYFLAGKFSASAEVGVERRYAWWSKASAFSSTILKKGDLWVACGNGGVQAKRLEALSVSIALQNFSCTDKNCENGEFLGWFPPPPKGFPKPDPFPKELPGGIPPDGDGRDDDDGPYVPGPRTNFPDPLDPSDPLEEEPYEPASPDEYGLSFDSPRSGAAPARGGGAVCAT